MKKQIRQFKNIFINFANLIDKLQCICYNNIVKIKEGVKQT